MPVVPTDAVKNPSPQLQVVLRWMDALTTDMDLKALESILTDDYTHQFIPQSLGDPVRNKAAYLEFSDTVLMRAVKDLQV